MLPRMGQKDRIMRTSSVARFVLAAFLPALGIDAAWLRILSDSFDSASSNAWTYAGVSNATGQALFRVDAGTGVVRGEWDQGNSFDGTGDPYVIGNSRLSRPLPRTLDDRRTFRFGATLRIAPSTIPNTLEFYQIANFGLYRLSPAIAGDDRVQSDNFSGNTSLVRDANDLVEFNYFINNDSFSWNPYIQGVAIGRMPADEVDSTAYFVTGASDDPMFHNTDMGVDHYLPEGVDLYVEVVYHGADTNEWARRVYAAIYTDAAHTNLLTVNGVPMYYWTKPAPSNRGFDVDEFAFFNYAGINWTTFYGGSTPDGAGAGSFDNIYVDLYLSPGEIFESREAEGQALIRWASTPGSNYAVVASADLLSGLWQTDAVVTAAGEFTGYTGIVGEVSRYFGISP
jgi:hypothetical protein